MIPCANPAAQFESYQSEIENAVLKVMRGNRFILGSEVEALEQEFADYIGTKAAIGVANGTDALELSLRALGIGPGDEVISVSHTAVATVAAIEATGATAVLVDVDPVYFTIDPTQLQGVLTRNTKAVIAVHLYGQSASLDEIEIFCTKNGVALVEDVSQAHGAMWNGSRLGGIGHIGCFSCYPTKNLGAIGDAGVVTTNDIELGRRVRMLREYGWKDRYISDVAGRNSRLDEIQAAILRIKLRHLDSDNAKRQRIAAHYAANLPSGHLSLPATRIGSAHVFHLYVVRAAERSRLIEHLRSLDIHAGIHYPVPIHLQPAYKGRIRTATSMKVTELLATEVLSLPMFPELTLEMADSVISAIKAFR